ncbi:MAG: hypothetical protein ABSD85_15380 [Acidimicrobiales bacterium]
MIAVDIDEPELSEAQPGESTDAFVARINLARRVLPILRDLVKQRFALVVESDRRTSSAASLTSDFVLEFGDARVRLILVPGDHDPIGRGTVSMSSLAHYMLDVPDSDAVAVVSDDEQLSTWVFDIYALKSSATTSDATALAEALSGYFESAVHPIELPDFRGVLALPSAEQLESALGRNAAAALDRIKHGRVQIEEKVRAINLIGPEDSRRLLDTLLSAVQGQSPSLSLLLQEDIADND